VRVLAGAGELAAVLEEDFGVTAPVDAETLWGRIPKA
jgi:hypothetical protein